MKYLLTTNLILMLTALFGCQGFGQTAKLGEQFTLKSNEKVRVKGTNIEITVNQIGRKWSADGGGESLDFTFSVKSGEKIEIYSNPLQPVITANNFKVEIVKTEPFGDGYAIFLVTKIEPEKKTDQEVETAAKFVEQFGWHLDESVSPVKLLMEFPANFDNLPFYHYQSASLASGIDLTPLAGKKVEMLKFTLKDKQKDHGADFTIFAHLIIENGKVSGAWRTDSSDRTPGIYSFVKK